MSFFKKLKKNIGADEQEQAVPEPKQASKEKVVLASATAQPEPKKKKIKVEKVAVDTEKQSAKKSSRKADDWVASEGQLAVDVFETGNEFCVRSPIAGLEPEEIDIATDDGMLVIKGERQQEEKAEGKNYFYQECYWGSFSRQIALPENVDTSKITASLKKGVLTIKMPKKAVKKKKKIAISTE